jgi:hypothetical protein
MNNDELKKMEAKIEEAIQSSIERLRFRPENNLQNAVLCLGGTGKGKSTFCALMGGFGLDCLKKYDSYGKELPGYLLSIRNDEIGEDLNNDFFIEHRDTSGTKFPVKIKV